MTKDEFMHHADALFAELDQRSQLAEEGDRLFKAVAEIERLRAERDAARAAADRRRREHEALVETAQKALENVTAERDEARAEVARLTKAIVERIPTECVGNGDFYDHGWVLQEDANKERWRLEAELAKATAEAYTRRARAEWAAVVRERDKACKRAVFAEKAVAERDEAQKAHDRRVQAQALREAAGAGAAAYGPSHRADCWAWLRDRADDIERGGR